MALPAGRYGVTKNQLLKIKKLPMNTIKLIEELTEKFNLLGTAAFKNSTSVVTQSTDLVESGAVKDIVGWGNKNKFNYNAWKGVAVTKGTGVFENNGVTLTATETNAYTRFELPNYPENAKIPVEKGKTIKLTWDCDETVHLGYVFIFPNGTPTGSVNVSNLNKQLEYTPSAGVTFITFRVGVTTSGKTIHYKDIMISKDGGAYEPYHASVEQTLRDAEVVEGKNKFNPSIVNWNDYTYADGLAKNAVTDTREFLLLQIQGRKNGTFVKVLLNSVSITTVGNHEVEFTVESGDDINQLYIGHNGSSNNIVFIYPFELKGTYKLSFKVTGVNPKVVNGIVLSDIMISANGGAYEPYYIPLKDALPNKCDNSVIGTVEDGTTASQAYAVREHFIRNGAFCTVTQAISQGGSFTLGTNYTAGDVADEFGAVQTFNTSNASITDFIGKYVITGNQCTVIAKYTKKGASYTIANIADINMADGLGDSSDPFICGKGASGEVIRVFNNGTALSIQEPTSVDQTAKTYINFTFPIK